MQTSYYDINRFAHREGNVIYLTGYRRQAQSAVHEWETEGLPYPAGPSRMTRREERRQRRRVRQAWTLDVCASLSVILLTAAFALQVLKG